MTGLLESCQNYVVSKQSNLTHWHPVLGWFAQPMDTALHAAMQHVKIQLHLMWNNQVIGILLGNYIYITVTSLLAPVFIQIHVSGCSLTFFNDVIDEWSLS